MIRPAFIAATVLLLGGCVAVKQDRVEVALTNAGLPQPLALCMAHRLARKLTVAQLHRLAGVAADNHSFIDYLAAVEQVHDPDALEVLVSSAALCRAGLIH